MPQQMFSFRGHSLEDWFMGLSSVSFVSLVGSFNTAPAPAAPAATDGQTARPVCLKVSKDGNLP